MRCLKQNNAYASQTPKSAAFQAEAPSPAAVRRLLRRDGQLSEDIMRARPGPPHSAKANCIFVVESDEVVRSALQFILDDHDKTHGFASFAQAIAEAPHVTPDVVLLGVGFVQTNGERLLAEIARHWPGVKILIVANSVNDRLAHTSLKWGADDVLGKPITFEGVRSKVDALLVDQTISPALLSLLPLSAAW
jgi:CheY-like chemotaxis protein